MFDVLLITTLAVLAGTFVLVLLRPGVLRAASARRAGPVGGSWPAGATWIVAIAAASTAGAVLAAGAAPVIAFAAAVLAAVLASVLARTVWTRRRLGFELDLAAALDLMVASLRSGSALVEAMDAAARQAKAGVRGLLSELGDRLRLGDSTAHVLDDLEERHRTEGVRLFVVTLGAHLDSGGSAATSLAEVARSIRERADLARRVNAQSAETQASVIGILGITYGLAMLMSSQYPDRVDVFVASELGSLFIGASIALQALGLAWIASTIRTEG